MQTSLWVVLWAAFLGSPESSQTTQNSEFLDAVRKWNPSGTLGIDYFYQNEVTTRTTPRISLWGGLFPRITDEWSAGLALATGTTGLSGSESTIELNQGMSPKAIVLNQAYLRFEWGQSDKLTVLAGKWPTPLLTSPLFMSKDRNPEGFLETYAIDFSDDFTLGPYFSQLSLDQVPLLTSPERQSWLFIQGIRLAYSINPQSNIQSNFSSAILYDVSERVFLRSQELGQLPAAERDEFLPLEWLISAETQGFGLATSISAAAIWNARAPNKRWGLWVEGSAGNSFEARALQLKASYFFNQPHTQLALLTETTDFSYANRHGAEVRLSYFPWAFVELKAVYRFSKPTSQQALGDRMHQVIAGCQLYLN